MLWEVGEQVRKKIARTTTYVGKRRQVNNKFGLTSAKRIKTLVITVLRTYWIGEKEMSYFVNRWRHLNISGVVLIASGQTVRRFGDDNLCYKCLFDSVVIVRFSLKLYRVIDGVHRARNSSYFTFLLPER